jgi:hypothetical protein
VGRRAQHDSRSARPAPTGRTAHRVGHVANVDGNVPETPVDAQSQLDLIRAASDHLALVNGHVLATVLGCARPTPARGRPTTGASGTRHLP